VSLARRNVAAHRPLSLRAQRTDLCERETRGSPRKPDIGRDARKARYPEWFSTYSVTGRRVVTPVKVAEIRHVHGLLGFSCESGGLGNRK
jgi:hypothetical protein